MEVLRIVSKFVRKSIGHIWGLKLASKQPVKGIRNKVEKELERAVETVEIYGASALFACTKKEKGKKVEREKKED